MVRRIQDQSPPIAVRDLKTFIRKDREEEITEETIKELNELEEDQALWYIQNLRTKPRQVRTTGKNQMDVSGVVKTMDTLESFPMKALIDSGCTGSCINEEFVKKHRINLVPLPKPIPVFNADGSQNIGGKITHLAQLKINIGGHEEVMDLRVSNLGKSDIFLGHDWLRYHNPEVDWKKRIIQFNRCPGSCHQEEIGEEPEQEAESEIEEGERLLTVHIGPEELNMRTKTTHSTEIASAHKDTRMIEEILPSYCLLYRAVFEKKTFNELLPQCPWDHAIELIPGAKPLDCKIYPLSRDEQTQLEEFLKENLDTHRI